uniref:THAP domain-containing protein 2-like n=1 Tax=Myxine glutinosa TaxID=7769 RepID=UPI00358F8FAD
MPSCAAINCTNRLVKGSGKTFHRFPKDGSTLQKEWLVKMRRDKWTPSKYASLCSDHFDAECFDRTGLITRLRQGSIPTIFNFPNHLQKTVKQRKPPRPEPARTTLQLRLQKHHSAWRVHPARHCLHLQSSNIIMTTLTLFRIVQGV